MVAARPLRSGVHSEAESKAYLAAYGLPVTREEVVDGPEAAVAAAERIGYPVALKVSSAAIAHKSDAGGVLLGLPDAAAVATAARTMGARFPGAALLVQTMVTGGVELIVGAQRTRATGPVIMLGIGGIFAEVLDDVVFCRAPASPEAVRAALGRLRAQRLLDGYRGMPAVNRDAVATIAARLSEVVAANPSIVEVDLNPVIAGPDGAIIVDALIRVEAAGRGGNQGMSAVIIGTGEAGYTRHPEPGQNTHTFLRDAVVMAIRDANLTLADVDGLAISSFSMEPDKAIDMAWRFGMSLRWLLQDTNGGAGGINMLGHAIRGVEAGAASAIVVVGGDAMGLEGFARLAANYNRAIRDHVAPLGHGGPNSLFAMLTQRQMRGLRHSRARTTATW